MCYCCAKPATCCVCIDEVNYSGWTSYVSNYFCRHIEPQGLLHDAERDLLAIAKFVVNYVNAGCCSRSWTSQCQDRRRHVTLKQ